MLNPELTQDDISHHLDVWLGAEFTFFNTAQAGAIIARLPHQELIEARRSGIYLYCITIDREARDYLPHMYGPAGFTVIDEVAKLPLKVSDIYRRLMT